MKTLSNLNKVKTALHCLILSILLFSSNTYAKIPTIAVSQFIAHEAVDAAFKGMIDELAKQGYVDGKTMHLVHKNAAGNAGTNAAIATHIKSLNPDVAVGLTTPSAQSLMKYKGAVVFSIVTDPQVLGKLGNNVTGVTDMPPVAKQIALIKRLLPNSQLIAVPYNPGEANSVAQLAIIKEAAQKQNLKIQELPVCASTQIQTAMAKAVDSKADAYLIPLDNILVGAMPIVAGVANKLKIPLFTSENESVIKNGALANVGFNYYDIGVKTGQIVAEVLKGEKPRVSAPDTEEYYFNAKAAKDLGIKIPEDLLQVAKRVVE